MHATIDQLLKLRDGVDADAAVGAHVRDCSECHAALQRLTAVTSALRSLPAHSSHPDRWNAIVAKLTSAPASEVAPHRRPAWSLATASAAVVLAAVLLTLGDRHQSKPARTTDTEGASTAPVADSRQEWVTESRRLEALLAALPAEPRVTRAQTALTVADLEDRLEWVDYRLNLASEAGLGRDQAALLWRERVDLLNSLVAVRYAEARTVAF